MNNYTPLVSWNDLTKSGVIYSSMIRNHKLIELKDIDYALFKKIEKVIRKTEEISVRESMSIMSSDLNQEIEKYLSSKNWGAN